MGIWKYRSYHFTQLVLKRNLPNEADASSAGTIFKIKIDEAFTGPLPYRRSNAALRMGPISKKYLKSHVKIRQQTTTDLRFKKTNFCH